MRLNGRAVNTTSVDASNNPTYVAGATATSSTSVAVQRVVGLVRACTATAQLSATKAVSKTVSVVGYGVVAISKLISKVPFASQAISQASVAKKLITSVVAVASASADYTKLKVFLRTAIATTSSSATFQKVSTFYRSAQVSASAVATSSKLAMLSFGVTAQALVTRKLDFFKTVSTNGVSQASSSLKHFRTLIALSVSGSSFSTIVGIWKGLSKYAVRAVAEGRSVVAPLLTRSVVAPSENRSVVAKQEPRESISG